jgi:hypothetical protein
MRVDEKVSSGRSLSKKWTVTSGWEREESLETEGRSRETGLYRGLGCKGGQIGWGEFRSALERGKVGTWELWRGGAIRVLDLWGFYAYEGDGSLQSFRTFS